MTDAYIAGFCKMAEAHGVDPNVLVKLSQYAQQHAIGSWNDNWTAAKNWAQGYQPGIKFHSYRQVDNDNLTHDMTSGAAPTLVDRIHGAWNGLTGGINMYGHWDHGKPISAEQYNNTITNGMANRNTTQAANPNGMAAPNREQGGTTRGLLNKMPAQTYNVDYSNLAK